MQSHKIITSDAGDVWVSEVRILPGVWAFSRTNKRPVNPEYCYDYRKERGVRIGSWCFLVRRTKRDFPTGAHPQEWMSTPL